MRLLEQVVIDTVARFGVKSRRSEGWTGVWVDTPRGPEKVCALGVRVSRNVTRHGLALNVDPDLAHFATIVPCGIAEAGVTSLRDVLGPDCPSMAEVKRVLVDVLRATLRARARAVSQVGPDGAST